LAAAPDEAATAPDEAATAPDEAATAPDEAATTPDEAATAPDEEAATAPDEEAATAPDEEAATAPDEEAATGGLLLKGAPLLLPGLVAASDLLRLLVEVNVALVHWNRRTRLLPWSTTNKKSPGNSIEYETSHGELKLEPEGVPGAPFWEKSLRPRTKEAEDPLG